MHLHAEPREIPGLLDAGPGIAYLEAGPGVAVQVDSRAGGATRVADDGSCLEAFQRECDYIYRTLTRLGAAPSDVEDLMQDVFLALHHSWAECDRERPLKPYLFGIAFRIVSAHRRKRRREVTSGTVQVVDVGGDLDEALQRKQANGMLLAALERIPLPRRAVVVMHDMEEIPVSEVASALKISRFTVYARLRKARRELAAALRRMLKAAEQDGSGPLAHYLPDVPGEVGPASNADD